MLLCVDMSHSRLFPMFADHLLEELPHRDVPHGLHQNQRHQSLLYQSHRLSLCMMLVEVSTRDAEHFGNRRPTMTAVAIYVHGVFTLVHFFLCRSIVMVTM